MSEIEATDATYEELHAKIAELRKEVGDVSRNRDEYRDKVQGLMNKSIEDRNEFDAMIRNKNIEVKVYKDIILMLIKEFGDTGTW